MLTLDNSGKLIDSETGEIQKLDPTLAVIGRGDSVKNGKILRKKSVDYLKNSTDMGKKRFYVRIYGELPALSPNALCIFSSISSPKHINSDDNEIRWNNEVPINSKGFARLTRINLRSIQKALRELCDKDVFARDESQRPFAYYVNPKYVQMGNTRMANSTLKMFEKTGMEN